MHRTTKRLASAVLAAVLCCAAALPAGADYEPWTYEVDDLMGSYGVEYYSDVGFDLPQTQPAAKSSSGGVSTQSAVTQPAAGGKAVVISGEQDDTAETPVNYEVHVYSAGGFNVYSAEGGIYTDNVYYKVTIPTDVEVNTDTNEGTLSISSELTKCSNLVVTFESDSTESGYYLTCGAEKLEYKMAHNAVVFSKDNTDENTVTQSEDIRIRVLDKPTVSGTYTDTLTFTITPREYTADVTNKHVLTFDLNDATTANLPNDTVTISTKSKVITNGEKYGDLPTPRRDGFDFEGWYTSKDGNEQVDADTIANGDATVYAHWEPHYITINYYNDEAQTWDYYGGSNGTDVSNKPHGIVQTEKVAYDGEFPHSDYGLLDVNRLHKKGYISGFKWKVGNPDSDITVADTSCWNWNPDGKYYGRDAAYFIGVLDELKEHDVTVDLYPVFVPTTSHASADMDGDAVVLLPSWNEKRPVNIDMPAMDAADADDTDTGDTQDTETTVSGVASDEPETAADTTPDDLMISEVDEMMAEFALQSAVPVWE